VERVAASAAVEEEEAVVVPTEAAGTQAVWTLAMRQRPFAGRAEELRPKPPSFQQLVAAARPLRREIPTQPLAESDGRPLP
jgi:hypothetical protein